MKAKTNWFVVAVHKKQHSVTCQKQRLIFLCSWLDKKTYLDLRWLNVLVVQNVSSLLSNRWQIQRSCSLNFLWSFRVLLFSVCYSFYIATLVRLWGTLRSNDADGNENVKKKKTKGLISKTTTLHVHHAFLYISFLFLHDFDVKMPNFAF